jgi:hypothetical protein
LIIQRAAATKVVNALPALVLVAPRSSVLLPLSALLLRLAPAKSALLHVSSASQRLQTTMVQYALIWLLSTKPSSDRKQKKKNNYTMIQKIKMFLILIFPIE